MADDQLIQAHGVLTVGSEAWWNNPKLGFFSGSPPCSAPVPDFGWLNGVGSCIKEISTHHCFWEEAAAGSVITDDGSSSLVNSIPPSLPPRPPPSQVPIAAHDLDRFEAAVGGAVLDSAAALEIRGFGGLSPSSSTTESNSNNQQTFIINHQQPNYSVINSSNNSMDSTTTPDFGGLPHDPSFSISPAASYALIQSLLESDDDQLHPQDQDRQLYSVPCNNNSRHKVSHHGSTADIISPFINDYTSSLNDILISDLQDGNILHPSLSSFSTQSLDHDRPSSATNLKTKLIKNTNKVHHELGSNATSSNKSGPSFKKPRVETASPLPTFKVRKEKLGDRIAALQQLVSPFGKTDTASVLDEAIEYIKFLHDQVNLHHQGSQSDLRSRGLRLVPISFTFAVAHETPVDFWTPTFGPTTTSFS